MKAAKKTVRYLKSTIYLGLIYYSYLKDKKDTRALNVFFSFEIIGYENSSYTGDIQDKK